MNVPRKIKHDEVLVGRQTEVQILQTLWQTTTTQPAAPSHTCLIHGGAGCGKTALVTHVASKSSAASHANKNAHFLACKFDQYRDSAQPYAELVAALEVLSNTAPPDLLQNCLKTEARILGRLIPKFGSVLSVEEQQEKKPEEASKTSATTNTTQSSENESSALAMASERIMVALQVFLRRFCSLQHPVIWFVDDLQWSDSNSCQLLSAIANDPSITNFLLLGCYRDEGAHDFDLQLKGTVTDLAVGPLDADGVDSLIGHMVDMDASVDLSAVSSEGDDASVSSLGQLIHRKTMGNPYFVVQFLETLQSQELLTYNQLGERWEWDVTEIAQRTSVSENVVDILRTRIALLPTSVQRRLVLAAYVSFAVPVTVLEILEESSDILEFLRTHIPEDTGDESSYEKTFTILEALLAAEKEGLVEMSAHATCRFSHDRIQECVYAMIPREATEQLHHLLGQQIWKALSDEGDPSNIFLAADQWNRGAACLTSTEDRMFLVKLNYKAALAAKSQVGIETASRFLDKALEASQDSFWEMDYDTMLQLHSFAAEVAFNRGDFDRSEEFTRCVLHFAKVTQDKIRALVARALAHGVRRDFAQGIRECRTLLDLLGVKMPRSSIFSFLVEISKTKKVLKNKEDRDILNIPDMKSKDMILAMKLLQHGSIFGWNSDTTFAGLAYLRMMQLTIQKGWCEVTPYALSGYAFLLAALGQEKEAFRYSQLALLSSRSRLAQPDVNMMVHSFTAHFERPAAQSLPPLLAGYRSGLDTGDMMCGSICMCCYSHVYLFSGLPLDSFAADMEQFARQLKVCRQDLALAFLLPALQLALNLSGKSDDPKDVSVESIQKLEAYNSSMFVDAAHEDPSVLFIYYLQVFSGFLFADNTLMERGLERIRSRKLKKLEGTQILNLFFILVDGLANFALYRANPRRRGKCWRHAHAAMRELEKLAKKRSINCVGILGLLRAEAASFSKRKTTDQVKRLYDDAIQQVSRSGFLHYSAMGNELAGQFMLRRHDDYWPSHYLSRAAHAYTEWGATVKAAGMVQTYPTVQFSQESLQTSGVFHHGKSQYDSNTDSVKEKRKNLDHDSLSFPGSGGGGSQPFTK